VEKWTSRPILKYRQIRTPPEFSVVPGVASGLTGCFFRELGAGNGDFWLQKRGENVVIRVVNVFFRWWFWVDFWFWSGRTGKTITRPLRNLLNPCDPFGLAEQQTEVNIPSKQITTSVIPT
jgi:hypothetical protein